MLEDARVGMLYNQLARIVFEVAKGILPFSSAINQLKKIRPVLECISTEVLITQKRKRKIIEAKDVFREIDPEFNKIIFRRNDCLVGGPHIYAQMTDAKLSDMFAYFGGHGLFAGEEEVVDFCAEQKEFLAKLGSTFFFLRNGTETRVAQVSFYDGMGNPDIKLRSIDDSFVFSKNHGNLVIGPRPLA
jgi:hypothetical protein